MLNKFIQLTSPFPDQCQYTNIRFGIADNCGKQGTFSAGGGGKYSHPLPFAAGQQTVNRPDTQSKRSGDHLPGQRRRRIVMQIAVYHLRRQCHRCQRFPQSVKNVTGHRRPQCNPQGGTGSEDAGIGRDPVHSAVRCEQSITAVQTGHFGFYPVSRGQQQADIPDFNVADRRPDESAGDTEHPADWREKAITGYVFPLFSETGTQCGYCHKNSSAPV